ncbi:MAG: hypothetical protein KA715_08990 [Xanthomonadaceae bacterium]|nr:hypothetical protein [Xanthomonadaceae bacterium]
MLSTLSSYAMTINPKITSLYGGGRRGPTDGGGDGASSALIQGCFTSEEQRNDFLGLIIKPGENSQSFYLQLKDEYLKIQKENSYVGSTSYLNSPNLGSAFIMFNEMAQLPSDRQGETTKLLVNRLKERETANMILAKINDIEKTLDSTLQSDLSSEQTMAYINEYFTGQDVLDSSTSVSESFNLIDIELQKMKTNTNTELAKRSGLIQLAEKVHAVAESAKLHGTSSQDIASQKKSSLLI